MFLPMPPIGPTNLMCDNPVSCSIWAQPQVRVSWESTDFRGELKISMWKTNLISLVSSYPLPLWNLMIKHHISHWFHWKINMKTINLIGQFADPPENWTNQVFFFKLIFWIFLISFIILFFSHTPLTLSLPPHPFFVDINMQGFTCTFKICGSFVSKVEKKIFHTFSWNVHNNIFDATLLN